MGQQFQLPELDDGTDDGTLVAWHVEPGERVAAGSRVAEVETDKSVIEVTIPESVAVTELLRAPGDTVAVGDALFSYEETDSDGETDRAATDDDGPKSAVTRTDDDDGPKSAVTRTDDDGSGPQPATQRESTETRPTVHEGDTDDRTEVLVVGAGPGGYVTAIKAARYGLDVTLVEKEAYGGTCLNFGCIPSKALIHGSDVAHEARNAGALGITAEVDVDVTQLVEWKDGVVDTLTGGVEGLCEAAGVTLVDGVARFVGEHAAAVETADGTETVGFEYAVVATGSRLIEVPGFEPDGEYVLDSRDALAMESLPESLLVVGAGYIGMELSTVFAKLGTDVTVVEMFDDVLPIYEDDISRIVREQASEYGVEFRFGELADHWEHDGDGVRVWTETEDGETTELAADAVLTVVGREPVSDTVSLAAAGIETDEDGFIPTDAQGRTVRDHIFAIGDVTSEPMLAHKAMHEGEVAAAAIAGEPAALDHAAMPAAVFTDPEVATVGLTSEEAAEAGYSPVTGQMPMSGNGRALTVGSADGFVRVVADEPSGRVLGVQMVAPNASELLGEATLAIEHGLTLEALAGTVHTHPTLSEAVMEAAADARGEAIHTH